MPHPEGQKAYVVTAQFPWQSQPLTKAMIEISCNETTLLEPVIKPLIHPYGETITLDMQLYSIEEIIVEKLRAILQHTKKLHERDWSRSRARDYYDLWRIFDAFEDHVDFDVIRKTLPQKCATKNVIFKNSSSFFDPKMIKYVSKTWDHWLGPLVQNLPNPTPLLQTLKTKLSHYLDHSMTTPQM